ncbi:hypothetical protein [Paramicrobacterium chengjingii]|uniref:hypothetical protein n=1 Tax=Paramicrobacterium chengjingii TaxID=2769067 RepID=UPI0014248D4F|nr:hypothetical protein [Microbacterium chengjingii]
MPTFTDPTRDANDAYEALRGLAHATRSLDTPAHTYPVIGDLLGGVRAMRQVLDQLADTHLRHQHQVTDDTHNHAAGSAAALAAADELHQAATFIDQAEEHLSAALTHSGQIVWSPPDRQVERWVGIVFLQGEEADRVLDLIDTAGPGAGIDHLSGWDYGAETTDAAMANGDVHDTPPVYTGDRTAANDDYTMTYNPQTGHVALYRRHLIRAEDAIDATSEADATARRLTGRETMAQVSAVHAGGWFEHPGVAAVKQSRGLTL